MQKRNLAHAENRLKELAYASVLLDALVALATFMSFESSSYVFKRLLYIGDYMIFVEVAIAVTLAALIMYLKYSYGLFRRIELSYFRHRVSLRSKRARSFSKV